MDFNLFVHPRSERKGVYTGKLFDYISAAKPILACVDKDDVAAKMIEEFDLKDMVSLLGLKPHQEALKFQAECDALLLTSVKVIDGQDYCIAGKTYEYICRKKPILAVLTEGNQKRFIEKTGLGIQCPPDDTVTAVAQLEKLLDGTIKLKPNQEFIESVQIGVTTKQLAEVIKKYI